jgi:hypothetical protein
VNISLDQVGRKSLIELIELMLSSPWSSKKTIHLTSPLDLGQDWITDVGPFRHFDKLVLVRSAGTSGQFQIFEDRTLVELHFTDEKLHEFKQHLINGTFDQGMRTSNLSDHLVFW